MPDQPQKRDEEDSAAELRESLAAIREGLADAEMGRMQPLAEAFADLRKELGIAEYTDEAGGGR